MSKWLVLYGTTDGHTRTVAERMGEILREIGNNATIYNVAELSSEFALHEYDAVWIGGSAHQAKHQAGLERFVSAHVDTLNTMPSAFFP